MLRRRRLLLNFTLTAVSGSQINLSWSDVSNETGYRVYKWNGVTATWQVLNTLNANVTTYSDKNLTAGVTYFYYVEAFNTAGAASAALSSVATVAPPAAPANFTATAVSATKINLTWSASAGATSYRVYKWTNGAWSQIANLNATATSFSPPNLTANTMHLSSTSKHSTASAAVQRTGECRDSLIAVTTPTQRPRVQPVVFCFNPKNHFSSDFRLFFGHFAESHIELVAQPRLNRRNVRELLVLMRTSIRASRFARSLRFK